MNKRKLSTAQLAAVLSVMAIISKLLGFLRELLLANYYGASYVTDAYIMSMSIPNNLLAGIVSAAMTAYMPVFSRKVEKNVEEGYAFTSQTLTFLLSATGIAAVLGGIFARPLVHLFAPGFEGATAELTIFYTRVAFVMIVFSVFWQVLGAYLQYKGVFIITNIFAYIQNALIIAAIIISAKTAVPEILIFGIAGGYLVNAVGTTIIAKRQGYSFKFNFKFSDSVKDVITLAIPVFLGSCAGELNAFIDRILASNLPEGSVSALNYGNLFANVVSAFTVGIFITIIYPRLAKAFAREEYDRVSDMAERGINIIVLLMLPMTLGSMLYSNQIVQVVYERGAFSDTATSLTATAYFYYAIAMTFAAVKSLLEKIFFAAHDTKTPVICSAVAVACNIVLNLILVRYMAHGGLALATSISQIVSTVLEYILFRREFPAIRLLSSFKKIGLISLFSVISVGASYAVYYFVGNAIWMPRMVLLGLAVLAACVIYLIFLYIGRFEELNLIKDLIARRSKEA